MIIMRLIITEKSCLWLSSQKGNHFFWYHHDLRCIQNSYSKCIADIFFKWAVRSVLTRSWYTFSEHGAQRGNIVNCDIWNDGILNVHWWSVSLIRKGRFLSVRDHWNWRNVFLHELLSTHCFALAWLTVQWAKEGKMNKSQVKSKTSFLVIMGLVVMRGWITIKNILILFWWLTWWPFYYDRSNFSIPSLASDKVEGKKIDHASEHVFFFAFESILPIVLSLSSLPNSFASSSSFKVF